jgi:predicted  nucleic acid-binding Zn-ribbon protein
LAAGIPPDLLSLYDRVRADHAGIGAALLQAGVCQGCHISLDAAQLEAVRNASPDAVVRCDQCRSILVRTSESGL